MTRAIGAGSSAGTGTSRPFPGFGRFGNLSTFRFDWFIDPASGVPRPPIVQLRVYPFGDPRTFFLAWDACSNEYGCGDHPAGSWETTSVMGHLSILPAEGNTPPPSLADIPADAPIVDVSLYVNYANGLAWHAFADNVTIGFTGQAPVVFNFEVPPPRGKPAVAVLPGDPGWIAYYDSSSAAAITGMNPGSGFGSLEISAGAALDGYAGLTTQEVPLPGYGAFGNLTVLNTDWYIDPASGELTPPVIALRIYASSDPRTFFVYWDGCCGDHPAGSWQTTDLSGRLAISPGGGNPPPDSIEDIPPDAPIVAVYAESRYGAGVAWHGFVDNVTIGFAGQSPITYDFEVPVPRGPATVVRPGDAPWFGYASGGVSAITNANPRSGLGSLEMSRNAGPSSFAGLGRNDPPPGFGTLGNLNVYNYDWFLDPANASRVPPNIRIRVYPFGDPRTFFLWWNGCLPTQGCIDHPAGSWQTTNLIGHLTITRAENNPPPISLDQVSPDAPISSIYIDSNYAFNQAWHGFVDNVTIGFTGQAPITFNFEPPPPLPDLIFEDGFE
jgi:hypothetical protein